MYDPIEELPPLTIEGDLSQQMVAGLHRYFDRLIKITTTQRKKAWQTDLSSPQAYTACIAANRQRFAEIIGLRDQRVPCEMTQVSPVTESVLAGDTARFSIHQVRWSVLEGISGEGLLLTPKGPILGRIVAVPDADQEPEQLVGLLPGVQAESQFARRLGENGFQVLVMSLVNRDTWLSTSQAFGQTNMPHREWIFRQAFEMGRHIIGFEVQKIQSAIDWFKQQASTEKVGVAGYGEGGLLAFYAAAVDEQIDAALVSGYFRPRQGLWQEPIYRNVWSLLREFGDAEIASLVAPRSLIIEYSHEPDVDYSPPLDAYGENGAVAAPGKLITPTYAEVKAEFERVSDYTSHNIGTRRLVCAGNGAPISFGSSEALTCLTQELGVFRPLPISDETPNALDSTFNPRRRQWRQLKEIERFCQALVRESDEVRQAFFLNNVRWQSMEDFKQDSHAYRTKLWEDLFGRLEDPQPDINPRARLILEREKWLGYEICLDVWPDVFAWGILCLPKDLKEGEKRPVVVCQHGYECLPIDTIEDTPEGITYYKRFASRLAERGFITYAPHNPYRGFYHYKQLWRKMNPLKASMASIILAQHKQLLRWLSSLPFVDPNRIGFYGLSYGGWTAVRIPPVLEGYCLSICSANFNDWIRKVTSLTFNNSYMQDHSFEMLEWNAGNTFNYAEMASLMAPRPFMVERGMHDPVAPDSWVASEYAKVSWLYTQLGIADQTEIEFFNGEHVINGEGTFKFLHKHLRWPEPNDQE